MTDQNKKLLSVVIVAGAGLAVIFGGFIFLGVMSDLAQNPKQSVAESPKYPIEDGNQIDNIFVTQFISTSSSAPYASSIGATVFRH